MMWFHAWKCESIKVTIDNYAQRRGWLLQTQLDPLFNHLAAQNSTDRRSYNACYLTTHCFCSLNHNDIYANFFMEKGNKTVH